VPVSDPTNVPSPVYFDGTITAPGGIQYPLGMETMIGTQIYGDDYDISRRRYQLAASRLIAAQPQHGPAETAQTWVGGGGRSDFYRTVLGYRSAAES
jgi:hypothetical protein